MPETGKPRLKDLSWTKFSLRRARRLGASSGKPQNLRKPFRTGLLQAPDVDPKKGPGVLLWRFLQQGQFVWVACEFARTADKHQTQTELRNSLYGFSFQPLCLVTRFYACMHKRTATKAHLYVCRLFAHSSGEYRFTQRRHPRILQHVLSRCSCSHVFDKRKLTQQSALLIQQV